jgi:hypothetical protein
MKDSILRVCCPCCQATLEIDGATGIVLAHEPPKRKKVTKDLAKAVQEVRGQAAKRDETFRKAVDAQKQRETQMEQKFEGLFKRQKGKPVDRPMREIDLD